MAINVVINGFGRIGRCFMRCYLQASPTVRARINIVAINDPHDAAGLVHLLQYDSTHGKLATQVDFTDGCLRIAEFAISIPFLQQPDVSQLPWAQYQVDLVLECSGVFRHYAGAMHHIKAGAKRVLIGAAPFDHVDLAVVYGVNHNAVTGAHRILSSVSCTTQALVPLVSVLHTHFGIRQALMTEIHAMTTDQSVLDHAHRDWRRARAASSNIIPTTSSALGALKTVLPYMQGKIEGYSIRVPTLDVAAIDLSFTLTQAPTIARIHEVLTDAANSHLAGIMGINHLPLVSSDFVGRSESIVIDTTQTMASGDLYKVFGWYDNEWGYAERLVDLVAYMAELDH